MFLPASRRFRDFLKAGRTTTIPRVHSTISSSSPVPDPVTQCFSHKALNRQSSYIWLQSISGGPWCCLQLLPPTNTRSAQSSTFSKPEHTSGMQHFSHQRPKFPLICPPSFPWQWGDSVALHQSTLMQILFVPISLLSHLSHTEWHPAFLAGWDFNRNCPLTSLWNQGDWSAGKILL